MTCKEMGSAFAVAQALRKISLLRTYHNECVPLSSRRFFPHSNLEYHSVNSTSTLLDAESSYKRALYEGKVALVTGVSRGIGQKAAL